MNLFGKLRDFLTYPTHKRTLGIVIMFVLAAAVSLTVVLSQQQQTIRQRAAEPAEQLAKGYVLCGSGLRSCQNGITVDTNCDEGKNKCLSTTANFSKSDRINGKSLTCCPSDRYRMTDDDECTLVAESYPSSPNESPNCFSTGIPVEPKESDYPSCWDGNDPPALDCEASAVNLPCSPEKPNKCLSKRKENGADIITRKFLVCCNAKEYGFTGNNKCTLVVDGEFSDSQCKVSISTTPTLLIGSDPDSPNKNILNFSFDKFGPDETVTISYDSTHSTTVTADSDGAGAGSIWISDAGDYTLTATGKSSRKQVSKTATAVPDRIGNATGYVPCGSDLQCKSTKIKDLCGQSYDKKCLTGEGSNVWIGADTVDDKKLVCCSDKSKAASYDLIDDVCTLTKTSAKNYIANACTPPNPPKDDPNYAPTPTPTPILPAGTSGSTVCTLPGEPEKTTLDLKCADTNNNISWNSIPGTAKYNVRINSEPLGDWKGDCAIEQFDGDVCKDNVSGTSEAYTPLAGKKYTVAVHIVNNCGASSTVTAKTQITCDGPAALAPGDTIIQLPAGAFATLFTIRGVSSPFPRTDQNLTLYLYKSADDPKTIPDPVVKSVTATLAASGTTSTIFDLGVISEGTYKILLKSPKYLRALVADNQTITGAGETITLTTLSKSLAEGVGDVNNDNVLDITDYNAILGCAGTNSFTADWCNTDDKRLAADINDDGEVNGIDLNIFVLSLSFQKREGD